MDTPQNHHLALLVVFLGNVFQVYVKNNTRITNPFLEPSKGYWCQSIYHRMTFLQIKAYEEVFPHVIESFDHQQFFCSIFAVFWNWSKNWSKILTSLKRILITWKNLLLRHFYIKYLYHSHRPIYTYRWSTEYDSKNDLLLLNIWINEAMWRGIKLDWFEIQVEIIIV